MEGTPAVNTRWFRKRRILNDIIYTTGSKRVKRRSLLNYDAGWSPF